MFHLFLTSPTSNMFYNLAFTSKTSPTCFTSPQCTVTNVISFDSLFQPHQWGLQTHQWGSNSPTKLNSFSISFKSQNQEHFRHRSWNLSILVPMNGHQPKRSGWQKVWKFQFRWLSKIIVKLNLPNLTNLFSTSLQPVKQTRQPSPQTDNLANNLGTLFSNLTNLLRKPTICSQPLQLVSPHQPVP